MRYGYGYGYIHGTWGRKEHQTVGLLLGGIFVGLFASTSIDLSCFSAKESCLKRVLGTRVGTTRSESIARIPGCIVFNFCFCLLYLPCQISPTQPTTRCVSFTLLLGRCCLSAIIGMCLSLAARYRRREVERRPVSPTNNTSAASVGFKGTSRNRLSCKCCRIVSVLSGWPRGNRKDDFGPG